MDKNFPDDLLRKIISEEWMVGRIIDFHLQTEGHRITVEDITESCRSLLHERPKPGRMIRME